LTAQWPLIFDLSLETGWRISDVLNLPNTALQGRTLRLTAMKTGKKDKKVVSQRLANRLKKNAGQFWLFPSPQNGGLWPLTRWAAHKALKKAGLAVEGQNIAPHSMRKTYAKRLYEDGVPIEEIQRLLQHERLETTALYVLG
jgi:integrase